MTTYTGPEKGQTMKFEVSPGNIRRIHVGLSWNPREDILKRTNPNVLPGIPDSKHPVVKKVYDIYQMVHEGMHEIDKSERAMAAYIKKFSGIDMGQKEGDEPGQDDTWDQFDLDLECFIYDAKGRCVAKVGPETRALVDRSNRVYHSGDDYSGSGDLEDETIHINVNEIPENYTHFVFIVRSDSAFALQDVNAPYVQVLDTRSDKKILATSIKAPAGAYSFVFCTIFRDGNDWYVRNIADFGPFERDWQDFLKKYL